jgi:tetratricopeptide (TPR) repeat protein
VALEMWQRIHPADHPDVATGLNNLANCLISLGGATDALPMLEAALAMRQRIYQREHPDLATSLHGLASCVEDLGRWAEAVTNEDAALAIWQRTYKGAHPTVAKALQDLGSFLVPLGRFDEANRRYQEALEMLERLSAAQPGNNSIKVRLAGTYQKIGDLLAQTAKPEEADKSYRKALEMAESVLALDGGNFQAEKLKLGCRVKLRLEEVEVVVSGVAPNGQAQEIGLHEGDAVFSYSGQRIVSTDQLTNLIGGTKGTRVELEVRRDGNPLKFTVREGPLGVRCEDRRIPN